MSDGFDVKATLQAFETASIDHPHRRKAMDELEAFERSSARIGFLAGPAFVGKSNAARAFADRMNGACKGGIPVLYARATGLCGNAFHVDRFVRPFAVAARVPALEHTVAPPRRVTNLFGETEVLPRLPKGSLMDRAEVMCEALRLAAEHRSVRLLVVDDIEGIFVEERRHYLQRIRCLEQIAEVAKVRMLLVGRDELVVGILRAMQNIRTMPVVRLARYANVRRKSEFKGFWRFPHKLVEEVPGVTMETISGKKMGELQAKCLGCPGLLVNLLREALRDRLELEILHASELTVDAVLLKGDTSGRLLELLTDIVSGEQAIARYVEDRKEDKKRLMEALKLPPSSKPGGKSPKGAGTTFNGNGIHARKVGETKPGRIMAE